MKFVHDITSEDVTAVRDKFYRKEATVTLLNDSKNELASKVLADKAIDAQVEFDVTLSGVIKAVLGELYMTFDYNYGVDFDTKLAWIEVGVIDAKIKEKMIKEKGFRE